MLATAMCEDALRRTTIRATFVSFRRSKHRVHPGCALLRIENVGNKEEATRYVGNGVVCLKKTEEGELFPVHGVVTRIHGSSGVVRAKFARNLNPKTIGGYVFVKLYKVETEEI